MEMSLEHALGQLHISAASFETVEVDEQWTPPPLPRRHTHLFVVLRGDGELVTPAGATPLSAGQLFVLVGERALHFKARRPGGLAIAHGLVAATLLSGQCVFDFIAMPHCVELGDSELFRAAVPELLRESAHPQAGSDAIVSCLVRRIVTFTLRDAWNDSSLLPLADQSRQAGALQKIVDAMAKDPARPYTLDSLATSAGMSRTAFHKMFTRTYGQSPLALLRGIRLKKAAELLTYTDLPIKTISARLGYRSRSYFWQTFKHAHGMDPESYRNAPRQPGG